MLLALSPCLIRSATRIAVGDCCEEAQGPQSRCRLLKVSDGLCAGAKSETACHHSRIAASPHRDRPCIWSNLKCVKGYEYGTSEVPRCPKPLQHPPVVLVQRPPPPPPGLQRRPQRRYAPPSSPSQHTTPPQKRSPPPIPSPSALRSPSPAFQTSWPRPSMVPPSSPPPLPQPAPTLEPHETAPPPPLRPHHNELASLQQRTRRHSTRASPLARPRTPAELGLEASQMLQVLQNITLSVGGVDTARWLHNATGRLRERVHGEVRSARERVRNDLQPWLERDLHPWLRNTSSDLSARADKVRKTVAVSLVPWARSKSLQALAVVGESTGLTIEFVVACFVGLCFCLCCCCYWCFCRANSCTRCPPSRSIALAKDAFDSPSKHQHRMASSLLRSAASSSEDEEEVDKSSRTTNHGDQSRVQINL